MILTRQKKQTGQIINEKNILTLPELLKRKIKLLRLHTESTFTLELSYNMISGNNGDDRACSDVHNVWDHNTCVFGSHKQVGLHKPGEPVHKQVVAVV